METISKLVEVGVGWGGGLRDGILSFAASSAVSEPTKIAAAKSAVAPKAEQEEGICKSKHV